MTEKIHLKTPAKLYDGKWIDAELVLGDENLVIGNKRIPIKEVEDIDNVEIENVSAIKIKKDGEIFIKPPEKLHAQVFRFLSFNLKADRFAVYFLARATSGGVVSAGAQWEKGYFSVTEDGLWFLSPKKQERIPLENMGSVEKDVRNVGGQQRMVLVLSHVEKGNVLTSLIMCPETTLEMVNNYLQRLIKAHKPQIELTEEEKEILTLIYSGLDSVSIENFIGVSTEDLNAYYDRIVEAGLANVVKIRKEIELTPSGVSMVGKVK